MSTRRRRIGAALLAGVMALAATPGAWAQAQSRGKVKVARGDVQVFLAAFNKWRPGVAPGQPIYLGDKLRTGPGASAQVVLFNDAGEDTIDLAAETLFEIPDVVENEVKTTWTGMFSYTLGKLKALVTRRPPAPGQDDSLVIRTPTVVAGVRGTEFDVEYDNPKRRSVLRVKEGVVRGLMLGGVLAGLFSKDEGVATAGLQAFRLGAHLKLSQDFLGGNQEKVNRKFNLRFHIAEAVGSGITVNGETVGGSWWGRELPFEGPGVDADRPMVVKATGGHVLLHIRHTGWLLLEPGGELSCYRLGNAFLSRLRAGRLHYHRLDPTHKPIKGTPSMEFEVFMAKPGGGDLRFIDYTPKGQVARVVFDLPTAGAHPVAEVKQGQLKVLEVAP